MRMCCVTLFVLFLLPAVAHAETAPASLDQIVTTELAVDGEVDSYVFDGLAGQTVIVTAAFGTPNSHTLGNSGRVRLIAADGSVLFAPETEQYKYQTAIYGRSVMDTTESGKYSNLDNLIVDREYLILQYWFFYPYNNFVWRDTKGNDRAGNNHEGDWEMIQLIVDPLRDEALHAVYSWHWAGSIYAWDELEVSGGTHPHVYVGKGGHANWGSGGGEAV